MKAELAILDILLNDATVSGIVGSRIYLDNAPQTHELPYIIVEEDSIEAFDSKDGVSATDHDIIRVFPFTDDKATLRELATACRNALDGHIEGTFRTVQIEDIRFISQGSFKEEIENRKVYSKDQEYIVRVIR